MEIIDLSVGTMHSILHGHLNLSKVSAKWGLQMLTESLKKARVDCCGEFLELCGDDPSSIIERTVHDDEMWIHHYDPEIKQRVHAVAQKRSRPS